MLIGQFSAKLGMVFSRQRAAFSFILMAELLVIKRKTGIFQIPLKVLLANRVVFCTTTVGEEGGSVTQCLTGMTHFSCNML